MPRLKFLHPTDLQLSVHAGDELTVERMTPDVQRLLDRRRIDDAPVCVLVPDNEPAETGGADEVHEPRAQDERAVAHAARPRMGRRVAQTSHVD